MSKFITFNTVENNPDLDNVLDVAPEEVNEKKDQITLVDVRTGEEYEGELGHIPGSKLITLDQLSGKIESLHKDQTIVFVCRSGGRSGKAAAFAKDQNFKSVYNMRGGMLLWNELGLKTEGLLSP